MINTYIAFDLETTGLNVETDSIIEIGAVKVKDGKIVERFAEFLKPDIEISPRVTNLTGITNEMVKNARDTKEVIDDFVNFCENYVLVGHNIMFDYKFSKKYAVRYGHVFEKKGIDTLKIARKVHRDLESRSLESLCKYYEINPVSAHRAYYDALSTAKIYHMLAHSFEEEHQKLFEPQQLQFKPKKVQPITSKQKAYLQTLLERHSSCTECLEKCLEECLEKNSDNSEKKKKTNKKININTLDTLTRSEASKIIDNIISKYGR